MTKKSTQYEKMLTIYRSSKFCSAVSSAKKVALDVNQDNAISLHIRFPLFSEFPALTLTLYFVIFFYTLPSSLILCTYNPIKKEASYKIYKLFYKFYSITTFFFTSSINK
jgi:hypothetical protein